MKALENNVVNSILSFSFNVFYPVVIEIKKFNYIWDLAC